MNKKLQGKRNRQAGARFERKVRLDLESKGWIVSKWMNNVEWMCQWKKCCARMISAKQGPFRMTSTGFPDFIAYKYLGKISGEYIQKLYENYKAELMIFLPCDAYQIIGVECKSKGYLDKEEKQKCKWLLDNNIFSKILIASKGKKRGEIVYEEFK